MTVSGILLFDKPLTWSSHTAVRKVKKLLNAKKAGHTGSLDPLATGMLPICFGEATKFSQFLLDADKTYYVEAKLGIKTSTGDLEGEVISEKSIPHLEKNDLQKILFSFLGEIKQIPPMHSALKHQGKPLYHFARKGISIERPARQITIHELILNDLSDSHFALTVKCSKGTYIRTLIEDIGEAIGCGAHVTLLRRIQVAPYEVEKMVTLEQCQNEDNLLQYLFPIESALKHLPAINLNKNDSRKLCCGQKLQKPESSITGIVKIFSEENIFLGVGEIVEGQLIAKRMISSA